MPAELTPPQCSKCGAALNMSKDSQMLVCPYCNAHHVLGSSSPANANLHDSDTTVFEGKTLTQWIAQLSDLNLSTQRYALAALHDMGSKIRDSAAADAIIGLIDNDEIAACAIWTLGRIGNPRAIPAILSRARTFDYNVVPQEGRDPVALYTSKYAYECSQPGCILYYCIRALGRLGGPEAIEFLTDVGTNSRQDWPKEKAKYELRQLGAPLPSSRSSSGCAAMLLLSLVTVVVLLSIGRVAHPRIYRDPIDFPGLATIGGEGLLEPAGFRGDLRDDEPDQD